MAISTLTVRARMPSDGAFIQALSIEAFTAFASRPARLVRRMLFEPQARSYVAELDGEPVALAVMSTVATARGVVAHLDAIAVVRHARGRGVGKRLLEYVVERARARGALSLSLTTASANLPARGLFERVGFLYMARQVAAYRGAQRAVLMFKPL